MPDRHEAVQAWIEVRVMSPRGMHRSRRVPYATMLASCVFGEMLLDPKGRCGVRKMTDMASSGAPSGQRTPLQLPRIPPIPAPGPPAPRWVCCVHEFIRSIESIEAAQRKMSCCIDSADRSVYRSSSFQWDSGRTSGRAGWYREDEGARGGDADM